MENSGNALNISRDNHVKTTFGFRQKTESLFTQVNFHGDGTEAQVVTIKKIRKDLKLEEENGVDSRAFYQKEPASFDDFVNQYRQTLKRLAKL